MKLTQPLTSSLNEAVSPWGKLAESSTCFKVMLYSSFLASKLPVKTLFNFKLSLNQSFIPWFDIAVKPSLDKRITAPLTLSVK